MCLDGLAEALAAECKDENNPIDVLTFFRERMRPFTKNGVAVLIADHVTKSTETRGRWARGSSAKLGRYDGASYSAELMQGYSPVVGGKVRLRVSKDRNGGVGPCGQIGAEITFTPLGGDRTDVAFEEPVDGKPFKPTAIMAKVCEHLASWPNASKNDLRRLGKSQYVDQAIDELVAGGFLAVSTKGQRMSFTLLKHYSEEEA